MKLSLPARLLICLCLVHLVVNIVWLGLHTAPVPWDQAGHTRLAIQYSQYLDGTLAKKISPLAISSYYPPLTHTIVAMVFTLIGVSPDIAAFVISLYLVTMLVGIYLLANALSQNPWVGLLTAAFFSFYLPIYENSRWFLLDIPLMTWLCFAWYFLYRSQGLTIWKFSFLFGLCTIGVFLTKWIGIAFLVVPVTAALLRNAPKFPSTNQLTQAYLVGVMTLVGIFPWYFTNSHRLVEIGRLASKGEITDPQNMYSLQNILFYFTHILNFQLTLWPALIAVGAAVIYFFQKNAPYRWLLLSFYVFGYVFFTVISNKDIRYTIPLLIVLAFTSAYMLVRWHTQRQWIGFGLLSASLVWLVLQYFILSFHLLPTYQRAFNLGPLGWIDYINTGDIVVTAPQKDTTANSRLIAFLAERQETEPASILVGIDQATTNPSTLDLEIILQKRSTLNLEAPYDKIEFETQAEMVEYIARFKYLIIPTGEVGPDASRHKKALQQIQNYVLIERPDLFEEISYYKTPTSAGDIRVLINK